MMRTSRAGKRHLDPRIVCSAALGLLVVGCATTSLTRQDVVRQYDDVAKLSDGLQDARGRDGSLLAPNAFKATEAQLEEAFKFARRADKVRANEAAAQGQAELEALNKAIAGNRQVMEEVLDLRSRANLLGASVLFKKEFADVDERFRAAARLLEKGKIDDGRKKRSELIERYAKLELAALKKGAVEAARQAILDAEEAGANRLAPTTLQEAREELKLAVSVLDADRTQVAKSNSYASRAAWLARRAHVITDLSNYFESQDFSSEETILWYQAQLQQVRLALREETLPFDQSNAQVIQALRADAVALKSVMREIRRTNLVMRQRAQQLEQQNESQRRAHEKELHQLLKSHEAQLAAVSSGSKTRAGQLQREAAAQVAELKQRLSAQAVAQAEEQRRARRSKERFVQVQSLFDPGEAEVFRKGNNVLVRLKGFAFRPAKHDVEARNYPLLNKVVAAINSFPESMVRVTGHTDARGSDSSNLALSAARAQSVVGFLSVVGGVTAGRLSAEGEGERTPVASNETSEGRAQNRRIDLLIVNDEAPIGGATRLAPDQPSEVDPRGT